MRHWDRRTPVRLVFDSDVEGIRFPMIFHESRKAGFSSPLFSKGSVGAGNRYLFLPWISEYSILRSGVPHLITTRKGISVNSGSSSSVLRVAASSTILLTDRGIFPLST